MKTLILFLLVFSPNLYANCVSMQRAHWRVDLVKHKVEWLKVSQKKTSICDALVEDKLANVMVRLTARGGKVFERKLYVPLEQVNEQLDTADNLRPTFVDAQELYLDSPIPAWAIKAPIIVIELASGKVLGGQK
jgi:hypothetical protein